MGGKRERGVPYVPERKRKTILMVKDELADCIPAALSGTEDWSYTRACGNRTLVP